MISWKFVRQVGPIRWVLRYGTLQFRKRILRRDSQLRLPTGVKIVLPRRSQTSAEIYVTNADMDWGAEAIFARFADPRRDVLDIGSHIGYYAAYLSPRARRVYAFEPDARTLSALAENAKRVNNIDVIRKAVSSMDGCADFFLGSESSTSSLLDNGGAVEKVNVTTIDSFVVEHTTIDVALIKTDIEGQDLEALRGMEATVARFQPLILTECDLSTELVDLCSRWKYRLFATVRDRRTQRKHFLEIKDEDIGHHWMKMIFLVPERLLQAFWEMTENQKQ